jgi:hypothetical protein
MDTYNLEASSLIRANVDLILPSFNKLIIDYETNVYTFHEKFCDHIAVKDSFSEGGITLLDQITKSFDFLDSVLDKENTETVGKDLMYKYDALKKETDYEIVFSQVYRILIVFRNAKVHDSKSIFVDKDNISVVRKDRRGKDIKVTVKKDIIDYILSYAIYYNNVRNIKINENYKLNIALWYYLKIKQFVLEFIDHGNGVKLIDTRNSTILAGINSRYICENVHYLISNNKIKLCIKPDFFYSPDRDNKLLDFIFFLENKYFMVPYEMIKNGENNISDLWMFEFSGDKSGYLDNFYNGLMNKNNIV